MINQRLTTHTSHSSNSSNSSSSSCNNSNNEKRKRGYLELFNSYVQDCVEVEINPSLNEVLKLNEKTMIDYTHESDPQKFKERMTSQFESICIPLLKRTTLEADTCIAHSTIEKIIQGALKKILKNSRKRVALKSRIIATHLLEIEIERSGELYKETSSKKPKLMNEDCNDDCNNNQPTDVDDNDSDVDSFYK
ncbi:hypothetical protein BDC45DRAFT_573494 [Circinella umbellata]|nr:hypothetical protein BDC45DRAFT_573494 [Circinella umbellata]